jgi:hypothetical protein
MSKLCITLNILIKKVSNENIIKSEKNISFTKKRKINTIME